MFLGAAFASFAVFPTANRSCPKSVDEWRVTQDVSEKVAPAVVNPSRLQRNCFPQDEFCVLRSAPFKLIPQPACGSVVIVRFWPSDHEQRYTRYVRSIHLARLSDAEMNIPLNTVFGQSVSMFKRSSMRCCCWQRAERSPSTGGPRRGPR